MTPVGSTPRRDAVLEPLRFWAVAASSNFGLAAGLAAGVGLSGLAQLSSTFAAKGSEPWKQLAGLGG